MTTNPTTEILTEALSCTLNRGFWFTAPGLVNMTGLDGYDVRNALDAMQVAGTIEVRFIRSPGTYGRREVRIAQ
jgi:hypothetical protein